MTTLDKKLEKFNFSKDKLLTINQGINNIVSSFNNLIDSFVNEIKGDIIESQSDNSLGNDMNEEDADKMLIIYGKASTADLVDWSLAKKRRKVVKLIKQLGKDDCQEYELAINTRLASLKTELTNSFKTEVVNKISSAIKSKTNDYKKPIEEKRAELAETDEYKGKQQAIEDSQAKKIVEDVIKKRASRRKLVNSDVARAAVSAVVDNCVEQTRENLIAQYDNAVTVARQTKESLEERDKDPVAKPGHYEEMEEITLEVSAQ